MSPMLLALGVAGGIGLLIAAVGGGLLLWRRARDPQLERRLRRCAAPLSGAAAAETPGGAESIFRPTEQRSWLRRLIESRYPLLDARLALPKALGAGVAGALGSWGALLFLRVPTQWWTPSFIGVAGVVTTW